MLEHPTIRILIADDHLLVRDGLKRLIDDQPGMEVDRRGHERLGGAPARAGVLACDRHRRLSMPGMDGVALTRLLQERCPEVRISR